MPRRSATGDLGVQPDSLAALLGGSIAREEDRVRFQAPKRGASGPGSSRVTSTRKKTVADGQRECPFSTRDQGFPQDPRRCLNGVCDRPAGNALEWRGGLEGSGVLGDLGPRLSEER